ncbi:predicted protein [Sclerotinia sclerotiorum 1980 UF-70]|uniref:Uncharacterized protein n=1 Tax=Sclerotinia sclerotiorum (strain ATCC 18683 / 1980 / Ss-1) TaxID=665079 RepID=A7ECI3_SCLS1|nr:predicted protein [Sclerotinia sclerotiorum 1980 UF-70]EDO00162.1 predicted protein [Sclerotinia sclerotiorum 1980 UF-70]
MISTSIETQNSAILHLMFAWEELKILYKTIYGTSRDVPCTSKEKLEKTPIYMRKCAFIFA